MYVVFLAGGIASGKSSVASMLEDLGCVRIDLDAISREVLEPKSPCLAALADEFGEDIIDGATGELDRRLLAERAFSSPAGRTRLEEIEHPFIKERLYALLGERAGEQGIAVVEIPLLDRMDEDLWRADEVVYVFVPRALRRERAIARGMSGEDFDARDAAQPSEDYLFSHADTVLRNSGSPDDLARLTRSWWERRRDAGV